MTKIYIAKPEIFCQAPNDVGMFYNIRLYQEGIVHSNDVVFKFDYDKDYPLRLFSYIEMYYDGKLMAKNHYLSFTTNKDNTYFTINDLFPNYEFRLDTTNKTLIFKLQRNIIPAKPNEIEISYTVNTTLEEKPKNLILHETIIGIFNKCKRCGNYPTSFYLEHEPRHFSMYCINETPYTDENYSNKPVKKLDSEIISYAYNDEKMEKLNEIHKGMNRYVFDIKNVDDSKGVICVLHYDYEITSI